MHHGDESRALIAGNAQGIGHLPHEVAAHIGVDDGGVHGIGAHLGLAFRAFEGEGFRQQADGALGRVVGGAIGRADDAGDGGQVDDGAATTPLARALPQQRQGRAAAEKDAIDVDGHHTAPVIHRGFADGLAVIDAGIVDEDIKTAEA